MGSCPHLPNNDTGLQATLDEICRLETLVMAKNIKFVKESACWTVSLRKNLSYGLTSALWPTSDTVQHCPFHCVSSRPGPKHKPPIKKKKNKYIK